MTAISDTNCISLTILLQWWERPSNVYALEASMPGFVEFTTNVYVLTLPVSL